MNPTAVVLFSGGADSSLAAVLALEKHQSVVLLTFKSGYELFIRRSCVMVKRLKEKYGDDLVSHKIINNQYFFRSMLSKALSKKGYRRFLSKLLFSERLSIYIQTARFCLENQVKDVYDGSNYYQGKFAFPQSPAFLTDIKDFFQGYGIFYNTPLYEDKGLSENLLLKRGLMYQSELYQKQRLFFEESNGPFLLDTIRGLWHKLRNKFHPIFFIETAIQISGILIGFKNWTEPARQKNIQEMQNFLKEKLAFSKEYLSKHSLNKG